MKTFASTASRIRTYAKALRAAGIIGTVMSMAWLGYVLVQPAPRLEGSTTMVARGSPVLDDSLRTQWLAALENRPFRPLALAAAPLPKPAPPVKPLLAPDIEIVGTMINPGQEPRAFVRSKASGSKLLNVQAGKQIDGATVKEITEGQVTVEVEGHEFIIKVGKKSS